MPSNRKRLDKWLVDLNKAPSRAKAQELIERGLVEWQGQVQTSPSLEILESQLDSLQVLENDLLKYVSRAGLKLQAALEKLQLSVVNMSVLDLGISTGGFTDCLLQKGAHAVVGVDVGREQLAPQLREIAVSQPERLKVLEGVNVRDLAEVKDLKSMSFDLVVIDLSFISVSFAVPAAHSFLKSGGALLALIKPQFELGPGSLNKKGVVKDHGLYETLRIRILKLLEQAQFAVHDYFAAAVKGRDGNQEFFVYATKN